MNKSIKKTKRLDLLVIIPVTRGVMAYKTINSVFEQLGFKNIEVVLTGNSTLDKKFCDITRKKYSEKKLKILISKKKEFPGPARNHGLNYFRLKKKKANFVLFLDDDVVVPKNYCLTLVDFLNITDSCAVSGRLISEPSDNFYNKVIDYSNFWWLQNRTNFVDRGWIGTGATLIKSSYLKSINFQSTYINEDTFFFNQLSKKSKKPLSICASTTAKHYHSRDTLIKLIEYQFKNGYYGPQFRKMSPSLIGAIRNVRLLFYSSYKSNYVDLKRNYKLLIGMLFSFLIFQFGIECQALRCFIYIHFKKK